jgi:hypothetical protein
MSAIAIYKVKIQDLLASMTPRDRLLSIGLVTTTLLIFFFGAIFFMSKSLASLEETYSQKEYDLSQIILMKAERTEIMARSAEIEVKLREYSSTDLSAFLEQSAKKVSIQNKLNFVRETSVDSDGVLEEKRYSVSLSNLSQEEVAKFLYAIETSGYPLKIRSCNMKTRKKKGEKSLEMTLDIAAFKLVETEEG